jgi:hypothetical protein
MPLFKRLEILLKQLKDNDYSFSITIYLNVKYLNLIF